MIRRIAPVFASLLTLPLVAGCAADHGSYPSLAPRAGEKLGFAEPVRAAAAATPDPALDGRVAGWSAELDRIAAGYTAAAASARRDAAAAQHQPVGSDAWLTGQAALARLDDWRSQASALAAQVEEAGSARAASLLPVYPALDALAGRTAAETDREATTSAELQRLLPAA
jgi:hypothetical protein